MATDRKDWRHFVEALCETWSWKRYSTYRHSSLRFAGVSLKAGHQANLM